MRIWRPPIQAVMQSSWTISSRPRAVTPKGISHPIYVQSTSLELCGEPSSLISLTHFIADILTYTARTDISIPDDWILPLPAPFVPDLTSIFAADALVALDIRLSCGHLTCALACDVKCTPLSRSVLPCCAICSVAARSVIGCVIDRFVCSCDLLSARRSCVSASLVL